MVHQIKSLLEVFKLKQNFRKNKIAIIKILFFVVDPFCTPHSIYLNIVGAVFMEMVRFQF